MHWNERVQSECLISVDSGISNSQELAQVCILIGFTVEVLLDPSRWLENDFQNNIVNFFNLLLTTYKF